MGKIAEFPFNAPVVGLPYKFIAFTSAVVLTCMCEAKQDLIIHDMLTGSATCPHCKKTHFVASMTFDRQKSELHLNLGQMVSIGGNLNDAKDN